MASAIEQNFDENGIIWPSAIAPFVVDVIPANLKDENQVNLAEEVYKELTNAGIDSMIDDRDERPGFKFKDADLIGYPLRITVGAKTLEQGCVEARIRKNGSVVNLEVGKAYLPAVQEILKNL